jgi:hypothetical protein
MGSLVVPTFAAGDVVVKASTTTKHLVFSQNTPLYSTEAFNRNILDVRFCVCSWQDIMTNHVPGGLFPNPDDHRLAQKIILKMGNKLNDASNPATVDDIDSYLLENPSQTKLERILEKLIDNNTPVKGDVGNDAIYLGQGYFDDPGFSSFVI